MDKKESGGKYNRRAHSVCCLIYHAVFVIKYRRKVIDGIYEKSYKIFD